MAVRTTDREPAFKELPSLMRRLYETGAYYVSVPAGSDDFEAAYWGEIVDPDGNRRDRRDERDQHLADVATELEFIAGLEPGRMLDVGCGLGWLMSAMPDGWEVFGLETSRFAADHAAEHGTVHVGTLDDCPFEDGTFQLIVIHHVIEHIPDPVAAIDRMHRMLAPGGRLVLGTPDFDSGAARRFRHNYRLLNDSTHISLFSCDSMHRFLRDRGFWIDQVDFPFFETRHFNQAGLERMFNTAEMSPAFYGNFMTFYCTKTEPAT